MDTQQIETTQTDPKAKWRQVYADAILDDMTESQWQEAAAKRELMWRGERQPLADVAEQYAQLNRYGYNEFRRDTIQKLADAFPNAGIEATPAREYSVAIYLHIPAGLRQEVRAFVEKNFEADEIDYEEDGSLRIWWD